MMELSIPKDPIIFQFKSSLKKDKLIAIAAQLSSKSSFVQLVDPKAVFSAQHIHAAYMNAVQSFVDGQNISNFIGVELLLYLSFTDQIHIAIKHAGIKNSGEYIIIASTIHIYTKFIKAAKIATVNIKPINNRKTTKAQLFQILMRMSAIKLKN